MKSVKFLILPFVLLVLAGMSKGLSDRIDFHQKTLPQYMQNSFWLQHGDNSKSIKPSWTNKWANGDHKQGEKFWGSSRWFVSLTDGWHLTQMLYKWLLIIAVFIIGSNYKKLNVAYNLPKVIFLLLITGIIVSIGFSITYR